MHRYLPLKDDRQVLPSEQGDERQGLHKESVEHTDLEIHVIAC